MSKDSLSDKIPVIKLYCRTKHSLLLWITSASFVCVALMVCFGWYCGIISNGGRSLVINSSKVVDVSDWHTDVINVLAIGGGGGGGTKNHPGGGGSGYLKIDKIRVTGDKRLHVSIGGGGSIFSDGDDTYVTNFDGEDVIALGGEYGEGYNGGDGWSGGGGHGCGAGGYNGGDGQDGLHGSGGHGQNGLHGSGGQNISLPIIMRLNITAGAGGQSCNLTYCKGGGGGGIFVNGEGVRIIEKVYEIPTNERVSGTVSRRARKNVTINIADHYKIAQGYGAGGGSGESNGHSGVVILYV